MLPTALLFLPLAGAPQGDEAGPYTLFHPVPTDALRALASDRPDATESPITVDAGHLQFEVSLVDWSRDRGGEQFIGFQTNAKVGLSDRTDLQFLVDPYVWQDDGGGASGTGIGDVVTRLKVNLWGNDGGDTAFALLPFLRLPTGGDVGGDEVGGGLALPFSASFDRVSLGLMASFDAVHDPIRDRHDLEVLHTAVAGFSLDDQTGAYLEYAGVAGPGDYLASMNLGLTRYLSSETIVDVGARVGLSSSAEDVGLFVGFGGGLWASRVARRF